MEKTTTDNPKTSLESDKLPQRSTKKVLTSQKEGKESKSQKKSVKSEKQPFYKQILEFYQKSIYYYFIKASKLLRTKKLKYISPFKKKSILPCVVCILDLGIVIYLNQKHFLNSSSWFDIKTDKKVK
jgi:hypothetical protein